MKSFLENFFIVLFEFVIVYLYMVLGDWLNEVAGFWGALVFFLFTITIIALVITRLEKWMEDDDED